LLVVKVNGIEHKRIPFSVLQVIINEVSVESGGLYIRTTFHFILTANSSKIFYELKKPDGTLALNGQMDGKPAGAHEVPPISQSSFLDVDDDGRIQIQEGRWEFIITVQGNGPFVTTSDLTPIKAGAKETKRLESEDIEPYGFLQIWTKSPSGIIPYVLGRLYVDEQVDYCSLEYRLGGGTSNYLKEGTVNARVWQAAYVDPKIDIDNIKLTVYIDSGSITVESASNLSGFKSSYLEAMYYVWDVWSKKLSKFRAYFETVNVPSGRVEQGAEITY